MRWTAGTRRRQDGRPRMESLAVAAFRFPVDGGVWQSVSLGDRRPLADRERRHYTSVVVPLIVVDWEIPAIKPRSNLFAPCPRVLELARRRGSSSSTAPKVALLPRVGGPTSNQTSCPSTRPSRSLLNAATLQPAPPVAPALIILPPWTFVLSTAAFATRRRLSPAKQSRTRCRSSLPSDNGLSSCCQKRHPGLASVVETGQPSYTPRWEFQIRERVLIRRTASKLHLDV